LTLLEEKTLVFANTHWLALVYRMLPSS